MRYRARRKQRESVRDIEREETERECERYRARRK